MDSGGENLVCKSTIVCEEVVVPLQLWRSPLPGRWLSCWQALHRGGRQLRQGHLPAGVRETPGVGNHRQSAGTAQGTTPTGGWEVGLQGTALAAVSPLPPPPPGWLAVSSHGLRGSSRTQRECARAME